MPLIFFAGGAAAAMSLDARRRRHGPGVEARWIADRLQRLGAPVIPLAVSAIAVDLVRFGWFGGVTWPGYANVLLVWGTIYLAGIHYGRGHRPGPPQATVCAVGGLLATGLAVVTGPYPASMIGMPESGVSNMNPPTAVLLGVAVIQLGVVMAARRWLIGWASRAPVTALLGWISQRTMTIYLWHTPTLVAVAGVAVMCFDYATAEPFSSAWRSALPAWLALLTGTLAVLARFAHRFEQPGVAVRSRLGRPGAAAAAVLTGTGLLVLTAVGFNPAAGGWPLTGAGVLVLG